MTTNRYKNSESGCSICGSLQTDWHHITYRSQHGSDSPDNLIMLCKACHTALHSERGDFKEWGRRGGKRTAQNPANYQRNLKEYRAAKQ